MDNIPTDPTTGRPSVAVETVRPSVSVDSILAAAVGQVTTDTPIVLGKSGKMI